MGRNASQLTESFVYQRLVTTLQVAIMLRDSALRQPAARSIRLESNVATQWDDHVETWQVEGATVTCGWQIKRQVERMRRTDAESLFEGFADTTFDRSTLAIAAPTSVIGVGTFGQLRTLALRLRDRKPDERALTAGERKWIRFIRSATGLGQADVEARVATLTVTFLGLEEQLRRDVAGALAALYEPPVDQIATALEAFAQSLSDGIEVTAFDAEQTTLARFASQRVRHVPTYCGDRSEYLAAISRVVAERRAVRGLFLHAPRLADVWIPVSEQLVIDAEVQPAPEEPWLLRSLEPDPHQSEGPTLRSALRVGSRHVLVAPVGAGKTEVLVRLAGELADAAQGSPEEPLPLLFSARTFADKRGLWESARHDYPLLAKSLERLERNEDAQWVALVDSLDEVADADADALLACLDGEGSRFFAVVAAARPSALPLPRATTWSLLPWAEHQIDAFIGRWERGAPEAVRLVRNRRDALKGLLGTPLAATLVLLAAWHNPRALESRARLFKTIVSDLFQTWSRDRANAPPWESVSRPLRALARAVVEGVDGQLAQDELEKILDNVAPDRQRGTEHAAERVFGLLLRTPHRTLDFALRPIGEFLAGEALVDKGEAELAVLASAGWAEEPVRHAIGLMDPLRAESAVMSLLAAARSGELRPLIVALRATSDRMDLSAAVRRDLASLVVDRLFDERSVWQGDRVADVLVESMGSTHTTWASLFERIVGAVTASEGSREAFLASRADGDISVWAMRLLERDPAARRVAIDRLAGWVDDSGVRLLLLTCILDQGFTPGVEPPAIAAGRALRSATRNDTFGEVLAHLRDLLTSRIQLAAAAAAVALHPDEADPALLVEALRVGSSACALPANVLIELASVETGLAALSRCWKDWRSHAKKPEHSASCPLIETECPSVQVHARLLRTALPWVMAHAPERAKDFSFSDNEQLWTLAITLAWRDPSVVIGLLERSHYGVVRAGLQRTLGMCALRHGNLAAALLCAVEAATRHQLQRFPGLALEELVREGSPRAATAFARWLPLSPALQGRWEDSPSCDLFEREDVRAVALSAANEAWSKANDGWIAPDGATTRLFQSTAGAVLRATQPVWLHDAPLREGLVSWLRSSDHDNVFGALEALRGIDLVEPERAAAIEATQRWIKNRRSDPSSAFRLVVVVVFLESAGLLQQLRGCLEDLATDGSTAGVVAASALASQLPRKAARQLSASVAKNGVADRQLARAPRALSRLVGLDPESWADAVAEYLRGPPTLFGSAATLVLQYLPIGARRRALRDVTAATAPELPWLRDDGTEMLRTVRPADALARLRFDAGLPMLTSHP